MKVNVKTISEIEREMNFVIPKERVAAKLEEVYKDISKKVKVKGFRQGKVPRNIIEAQHGPYARDEMIQKIIPEVYQEGLEQESLHPLDMPEISKVDYKDGEVVFSATLEVKPDVKIKDYKGIKVKRKSNEVTDDEMAKTLEYFKQGQGKDKDVKIDDEFAKGLGYPSLEEFKKSLVRQMEIDKDRQNRMDLEGQIVDALLKKAKFPTPKSMVTKHLEQRLNETKQRLKGQGLADEDIEKRDEEMRKELNEAVEKDVRVFLVMDKIAQLENVEAKEGENLPAKVMEFLMKEASWDAK